MKKLLSVIIIVVIAFTAKAQTTLEFNRPLYIELSVAGTGSNYVLTQQTITVPAGKTWKIEAAGASYRISGSNPGFGTGGSILLNERVIDNPDTYTLPIWLPAGTYTLGLYGYTSSNGYANYGFISGIEFNIN